MLSMSSQHSDPKNTQPTMKSTAGHKRKMKDRKKVNLYLHVFSFLHQTRWIPAYEIKKY